LKNKDKEPIQEAGPPKPEIHGRLGTFTHWANQIHPIYWIVSIAVVLALLLVFAPSGTLHTILMGFQANRYLVGMVLVFSLVALSLLWSAGQRIDVQVFMYFNMHGRRTPWFDSVMLCFTQVGNGIFAMAVALILFFKVNHALAYELALGTLTLWLVVEFLKVLIHRTRPYNKLKKMRTVGSLAGGRSFPSGHTSQTFFMATLLSHYFQVDISVWLMLYFIALSVGITRIYLGMHYPRDVIGGAILGVAWGVIGVALNHYMFGI